MEPRFRILHVFAPAPYGGLEQVVRSLASEQKKAGHTVAVVAVLDEDTPEHHVLVALRKEGIEVHLLRLRPRAYLRERALVGGVCDRFKPHVVHTHGYRPDVLHRGVADGKRIPAVTTVHGFTRGGWKNRFYEWLQRRAHRRFQAVVAVSMPLEAELLSIGLPASRLRCIPNAWVGDTEFFDRDRARMELGLEKEDMWIGYVGRLDREKGADIFLRAVASTNQKAKAVMIGDGSLRDELEERARDPNLKERMFFPGAIPGAARYMKALDVFVLSSRTEGTPIALLEAIAAEVAVVATRVGGVPDVVSEREALLVAPEQPESLAEAIDTVLANPEEARVRTDRALQRVINELSPGQWIDRYDRVYRTVTAIGPEKGAPPSDPSQRDPPPT